MRFLFAANEGNFDITGEEYALVFILFLAAFHEIQHSFRNKLSFGLCQSQNFGDTPPQVENQFRQPVLDYSETPVEGGYLLFNYCKAALLVLDKLE